MQSMRSYSLRKAVQNGYRRSSSFIGRDSLIRILDCPFQLDEISEQLSAGAVNYAGTISVQVFDKWIHYDSKKSRLV